MHWGTWKIFAQLYNWMNENRLKMNPKEDGVYQVWQQTATEEMLKWLV